MATDVRALSAFSNDTDAHFREWGSALSAALAAVGLVKASPVEVAGQIDWASVLRPTAVDQMKGYELWHFNDALQAACPVWIRISYGSCKNNANHPCVSLNIYLGAITTAGVPVGGGPAAGTFEIGANGHSLAALVNGIMTSGSSSRVAQKWMNNQGIDAGVAWGVERIKDANGADTDEGVIIQCAAAILYNNQYGWSIGSVTKALINNGDDAAQVKPTYSRSPLAFPAGRVVAGRSGIFGANTAVYPWIVPSGRGYENPGLNFVGVWNADIAPDAQFDAQMFGAAHHYRAFGPGGDLPQGGGYFDDGAASAVLTSQNLLSAAMRWE